jgi:predicted nucleotide-binding protein
VKKESKSPTNPSSGATRTATRKARATTLYPKYSLVESLKLAESIRDNNAGQPYNRVDLAASLDISPESSSYRTLITASSRYGLTEGSYQAERIALTELGKSIVSPTSDDERSQGLLKALYNVELYRSFFSKYQNHRLPRKELLLNTLAREFKIPAADCEQGYTLLIKNATELELLKDVSGTLYVRFDQPTVRKADTSGEAAKSDEALTSLEHIEGPAASGQITAPPASEAFTQSPIDGATTHKPRIFISHSKNIKILNQIKSNLEFGGFSYNVAIETETTAIPIPEKIFGMMRSCNCAIVNVSADESEKREDGSYGINANVLVEIGAAFLAYNQRVILLVDKRLTLPSNLQGLYRCEYQGDELDSSAVTRLQKGLLQFRLPVD